MSYVIRPYDPADADACRVLGERSLGGAFRPEVAAWQFGREAPAPTRWVAEAGGAVIAHYAVMPVWVRIGDREVLAVSSFDALTDPAWRGRGVMTAALQACGEAWQEVAAFELTLLTGGSGALRRRIGWTEGGRAVWMRRPLAPVGRALSRVGLGTDGPWRLVDRGFRAVAAIVVGGGGGVSAVRLRGATAADVDEVWAGVAGRWPVAHVADSAWMAWRLADPRGRTRCLAVERAGCPVGVVGLRVSDGAARDGFIVDAAVDPSVPLAPILVGAAESLAAGGATAASALAVPGSPWYKALSAAGFRATRRGYDVGLIAHQGLPSAPLATWWFTGSVTCAL